MKLTKVQIIIISSITLAVVLTLSLTLTLIPSGAEYTEHSSIVIWKDEDFESYNLPGTGTETDPYLIQNYDISSPSSEGIVVDGTTKHFIIRNCFLKGHGNGIVIRNVADGTCKLFDNIISHSIHDGIRISFTENNVISGNTISYSGRNGIGAVNNNFLNIVNNRFLHSGDHGASLDEVHYTTIKGNSFKSGNMEIWYCTNSIITENVFNNSGSLGIYIRNKEPFDVYCSNITISENIFENHSSAGVYFRYSTNFTVERNHFKNNKDGIAVGRSYDTIIDQNSFTNNSRHGIDVGYFSERCIITNNLLQNSGQYGVNMYGDDCEIHHNVFLDDNVTLGSQAYGSGSGNIWYDDSNNAGNYWSDWIFGEYIIAGWQGYTDPYPLYDIRL